MTDIDRIVRMLRVSESDPVQQEAADALEAQAKEIKTCQQTELTYVTRVADMQREYSEMQAKLEARIAELDAALVDVTAHLVAAVSLLERGGKKAAPSNKMFDQMIVDYKNCIERSRAALNGEKV